VFLLLFFFESWIEITSRWSGWKCNLQFLGELILVVKLIKLPLFIKKYGLLI